MEPYFDAYLARDNDVGALHTIRKVAATNMGGYAIECLLKYMVIAHHQITQWGTPSAVDGTPVNNVTNHDLLQLLGRIPSLLGRVHANSDVTRWVDLVQRPVSTIPGVNNFVALRYQGETAVDSVYDDWYDAYTNLLCWLLDQPEYQ